MDIFTDETITSPQIYADQLKNRVIRDGYYHVIMLNVKSNSDDQLPVCEWSYTVKVDSVLTDMQNDGFEIIDVKFDSTREGLGDTLTSYHVQIAYRWTGQSNAQDVNAQ